MPPPEVLVSLGLGADELQAQIQALPDTLKALGSTAAA
jgi:hypothetical protein